MLNDQIILAIEKAKKEFSNAIIWGAILYPETPDNPEEVTVFGGCSEESWGKALVEGDLSLNFHKLQTYRTKRY